MTYGKVFEKLYSGSMVGAGLAVYALMPYIITKGMPDKEHGGYIEMNPVILGTIFGCEPAVIEKAIEYLCRPDPATTTPGDDGRRIVKIGPFAYRIVNYAYYKRIKNEEDRREQNREAQDRWRKKKATAKMRPIKVPLTAQEQLAQKLRDDGQNEEADRIEGMGCPKGMIE